MKTIRRILNLHYEDPENLLYNHKGVMISVASIQMSICPEDTDSEIMEQLDQLASLRHL